MNTTHLLRASLTSGFLAGAIVATIATFLDWRLNAGGIFRSAGGSNWRVIAETAFSWWWPVAIATTIVVFAWMAFASWRRQRSNRNEEK